jgi:hypothetical protein
MDSLNKEKVSGLDQPLLRAKLTANRIWLANLQCFGLGVGTTTSRHFFN